MKILLVGDYPNDTWLGSAKVPHKLSEEFRALGHHCDLLFAEDLGDWPTRMHARQFVGPLLAERAIARAWRQNGPYDIVDIASGEGVVFGLKRRFGFYQNCAFISRSHGIEHLNYQRMLDDHRCGLLHKPWSRRIWYPLIRLNQVALSGRTADRLLLLNTVDRDFVLQNGWKKENDIAVIGHGVSSRFIEDAPPGDAARGGGILFCGTWTGMKGVDYLAPAFTSLIDRGFQTNLTILGGAVPEATIRSAFPPHVHRFLTIIDRVPEDQVISNYRCHDVLAFSSTYEGFGMVLLEAMSQRLPVVATPVGCGRTLVRDGETGLLVPPRDSEALADALGHVLTNEKLSRQLASNGFHAVQNLDWAKITQQTLELYNSARQGSSLQPMGTDAQKAIDTQLLQKNCNHKNI